MCKAIEVKLIMNILNVVKISMTFFKVVKFILILTTFINMNVLKGVNIYSSVLQIFMIK